MRRIHILASAVLTLLGFAAEANGQVISLLVGNQTSFNALDYYAFPSGAYQGPFAGPGTGPPGIYRFTYGPNDNLFLSPSVVGAGVNQHDGHTGNFIGTFVSDPGGDFTFGPDGHFYRVNSAGNAVIRYNGTTGQLIGTFVASNVNGGGVLHFGPGGDLFMGDGNTIKRFNGTTGAFLGNFTAPGAGGLATTLDFVFTPNGKLLVSGTGTSNSVLQFDGSSGTFLGVFAQGNGLSTPFGMTIGPDGNLYVASTTGSNSIARFDLDTGAFLGNFVNTTAHSGPTYIQFTPFPIPEPTSLVLVFAAFGAGAVGAARKVGSRQRISDLS